MEIRIVKKPPAPLIDGIDMRRFEVGRLYVVDATLARYMIKAGYASGVESDAEERSDDKKSDT